MVVNVLHAAAAGAGTETVTVRMNRSHDGVPWGFQLAGGSEYGLQLHVAAVSGGSLAERAGLRGGDALHSIGGRNASGMSHAAAQQAVHDARNSLHVIVHRQACGFGAGGRPWQPSYTTSSNLFRQSRQQYACGTAPPPPPPAVRPITCGTHQVLQQQQQQQQQQQHEHRAPAAAVAPAPVAPALPAVAAPKLDTTSTVKVHMEHTAAPVAHGKALCTSGFNRSAEPWHTAGGQRHCGGVVTQSATLPRRCDTGQRAAHYVEHRQQQQQQQEQHYGHATKRITADEYLRQTGGLFGTDPTLTHAKPPPPPPMEHQLNTSTLRAVLEEDRGQAGRHSPHLRNYKAADADTAVYRSSRQSEQTASFKHMPSTLRMQAEVMQQHGSKVPAMPHVGASEAPRCSGCGKNIVGVYCSAHGSDYHGDCFKCATCAAPLAHVGYHMVHGKLYCDVHAAQRHRLDEVGARPPQPPAAFVPSSAKPQPPAASQDPVNAFYQPDVLKPGPLPPVKKPAPAQRPVAPKPPTAPASGQLPSLSSCAPVPYWSLHKRHSAERLSKTVGRRFESWDRSELRHSPGGHTCNCYAQPDGVYVLRRRPHRTPAVAAADPPHVPQPLNDEHSYRQSHKFVSNKQWRWHHMQHDQAAAIGTQLEPGAHTVDDHVEITAHSETVTADAEVHIAHEVQTETAVETIVQGEQVLEQIEMADEMAAEEPMEKDTAERPASTSPPEEQDQALRSLAAGLSGSALQRASAQCSLDEAVGEFEQLAAHMASASVNSTMVTVHHAAGTYAGRHDERLVHEAQAQTQAHTQQQQQQQQHEHSAVELCSEHVLTETSVVEESETRHNLSEVQHVDGDNEDDDTQTHQLQSSTLQCAPPMAERSPSGGGEASATAVRGRGLLKQVHEIPRTPVCADCHKEIKGAFILALSQTWCPEHFVCAGRGCGRRLADVGFVEEHGNKYCEHCFEHNFAPKCHQCHKPISGDCLNALQKQWHPDCFTCAHCRRPFGNQSFYLEDGKPYCETDWNALFTTKCVACGRPIEAGARWVEALGAAYHCDCFQCTQCHKRLEGESFYAKSGKPYCKTHA